jgi:DNA-binding transcriptional LysR family regulator
MMHDIDDLRWDDLRVLLAVLRAGSFSRAAPLLGSDQSTVTRRIAALEARLGQPLFERAPRGPVPTPLAHALTPHAEAAEAGVRALALEAERRGRSERGRVRLATTASFASHVLLPHVVPGFRAAHPEVTLELVLGDQAADLPNREADLALRFFRPTGGDVVAKRLARLPTAVLARRSYARTVRRRALRELDWIVQALPSGEGVDARFAAALGAEPVLRVDNHLVLVDAVRAGLGVALLSRSLTRIAPELVVVQTPPELALPSVELWLVASRGARSLPRVDALWCHLEATLVPLLADSALRASAKRPRTTARARSRSRRGPSR